jgi:hypothetical protein
MKIVAKLILAIVILVIIYTLYQWYFSGKADTTLFTGPFPAELAYTKVGTLTNQISNILTSQYSYSIWVYIKDWSYKNGENKIIFSRKDGNGKAGPEVFLGPTDNTLTVSVDYTGGRTDCQVTQVPIQAWVNIIVVLNNQALDIYIDGKLTRTCVLGGVPSMAIGASAWVCPPNSGGPGATGQPGYDGSVSSFRAFPYPLNPREAYEIYREGHVGVSMNIFNKYRIKLAFLKDNTEMGSFEI